MTTAYGAGVRVTRDIYERDRKELLSLVQTLVDALGKWPDTFEQLQDVSSFLPAEVDGMDQAAKDALSLAKSKFSITPTKP